MTDRELLEKVAKAAGYVIESFASDGGCWAYKANAAPNADGECPIFKWNPLTDDGDALRLAVKLRIDLSLWINSYTVTAKTHIGAGLGIPLRGDYKRPTNDHVETFSDDPYAATRRAIVRAAAAIAGD